jgi:hypothetical protein
MQSTKRRLSLRSREPEGRTVSGRRQNPPPTSCSLWKVRVDFSFSEFSEVELRLNGVLGSSRARCQQTQLPHPAQAVLQGPEFHESLLLGPHEEHLLYLHPLSRWGLT